MERDGLLEHNDFLIKEVKQLKEQIESLKRKLNEKKE
jgi:cell division septum initiation protein DivIVA